MADAPDQREDRRTDEAAEPEAPSSGGPILTGTDRHPPAPALARVREEDLEPHDGLRYIAKLFKTLALFLLIMLAFELFLGFRQEGTAAFGTLIIEAIRVIVIAGVLWGLGDIAVILIESNHDLRATRILVGRVGSRLDRLVEGRPGGLNEPTAGNIAQGRTAPGEPPVDRTDRGTAQAERTHTAGSRAARSERGDGDGDGRAERSRARGGNTDG